jgi:hypothetical protein
MACSAMRSHWSRADAQGGDVELWTLYASLRFEHQGVRFLDYLRQAFANGTSEEMAGFVGRSA